MRIISLLLLMVSLTAMADTHKYKYSIEELLEKTRVEDDMHYMQQASTRCAGLSMVLFGVMTRDFPQEDWSQFILHSELHITFSAMLFKQTADSRGKEADFEEVKTAIRGDSNKHSDIYVEWFKDNFIKQGEYFGSSPILKNEMSNCNSLFEYINSLE